MNIPPTFIIVKAKEEIDEFSQNHDYLPNCKDMVANFKISHENPYYYVFLDLRYN